MSNIDKQALLVSKAKASVFTMEYISQFEASDIDSDDVDLRFEVDGVETGTTVSIVDECGHAAQIITALLDELEAEIGYREGAFIACNRWHDKFRETEDKLECAERRIAELEAREVMLPDRKSEIFWPVDAAEFDSLGYVIAVKSAIRAAMLQAGNFREISNSSTNNCREIAETSTNFPVTPDSWISCSERMPEDEQEVIVQNKLGYRYVLYFDEQSGLFFDMPGGNQVNCIEHILVTHWMPLSEPPRQ